MTLKTSYEHRIEHDVARGSGKPADTNDTYKKKRVTSRKDPLQRSIGRERRNREVEALKRHVWNAPSYTVSTRITGAPNLKRAAKRTLRGHGGA